LVVEWFELLAQKRFKEALTILLFSSEELEWTPEILERVIEGYGVLDSDIETLALLHEEWEVDKFEITSLTGRNDKDEIIQEKLMSIEKIFSV
jgi:hypothetical protein